MKGIFLKKLKDEKGQNLVEFALIVGLLLAIFFGITEFARAWYTADRLKGAANTAARTAAVTKDRVQAIAAAKKAYSDLTDADITFIPDSASFTNATSVKVTVRRSFRSVVPFMPTALGGVIPILSNITTIRRDATYRVEQ